MSRFGYEEPQEPQDRSRLLVIACVIVAVLALGVHFRAGLFALSGQMASQGSVAAKPHDTAPPIGALQPDPTGNVSLPAAHAANRAEDQVPACSAPAEPGATAMPQDTVPRGYYVALRDTPVRATPSLHAQTRAFVYPGQHFLVVGARGEYLEIRSTNRQRRNPPGFVLRRDVQPMG